MFMVTKDLDELLFAGYNQSSEVCTLLNITTKRSARDRDMAAIELLSQHLSNIKIPGAFAKIYKDECLYSFDTPVSDVYILHM